MKISQWLATIGLAASVAIAGGGVAAAAPPVASGGPMCSEGAIAIVTDSSGVAQQACVASAVEAPVAAPVSALAAPAVPARTGAAVRTSSPAPSTQTLPSTGAGTGGLIIAAALVGSGSIVSLLSRRRPAGARKGFRGRRLTP